MAKYRIPRSVEELADWYMRYISPLALIAGFIIDNLFLLRRVDLILGNVLLGSYLLIAALGILFLNAVESGRLRGRFVLAVTPLVPVVVQFAFGGLFSGYLSLYSRSASVPVAWIFVLVIAFLLIGNERFVRLYRRFTFQLSIFFTVLFSFLIFFLPLVFRSLGAHMFVFAGALSAVVTALFIRLLALVAPETVRRERRSVALSLAAIFLTFNFLYFSNAIPPLPLALKDAGIYHGVERVGETYRLLREPLPWYQAYVPYNTTLHITRGGSAYAFSAVFAPTGLETTIFHEWQYYDGTEWVTKAKLEFPIVGGRDGGYRGYSFKTGLAEGEWRVNVITSHGQLIGRIAFTVSIVEHLPPLAEENA
jgi:hypothetical protein